MSQKVRLVVPMAQAVQAAAQRLKEMKGEAGPAAMETP